LPDVLLFSSSRVVLAGPAWSWGGGRAVRGSGSDVVTPVNSDIEGIVAPDFFCFFNSISETRMFAHLTSHCNRGGRVRDTRFLIATVHVSV
jgi:hypothetical protein